MIIPWEVDVPQDRQPIVNWLIIAGIVAVFVIQVYMRANTAEKGADYFNTMGGYVLNGFSWDGLLGHMWLHGGIIHVLGNLLFLWIFGNAVCAKIGNLVYLPLYIFFGIFAAVMHLVFVGGPMIGASGAIMGVVGMFLVFFPHNEITCYFILFLRPYEFTLRSYWMILYWLAFDIWGATRGHAGGVAYFAHLGGFAAGFGMAVLMLKTGWIKMNLRYEGSIFDIYRQWRNPKAEESYDPTYAMLMRESLEAGEKKPVRYVGIDTAMPRQASFASPIAQETAGLSAEGQQMLRFKCDCGKAIKVQAKYAGKSGRCPGCGKQIRVPFK